MISIRPSQKIGIETPARAPIMLTLSRREFRLAAEMMPTGTPTTMATSMAKTVSSTVAGKRCFRSSATGRR